MIPFTYLAMFMSTFCHKWPAQWHLVASPSPLKRTLLYPKVPMKPRRQRHASSETPQTAATKDSRAPIWMEDAICGASTGLQKWPSGTAYTHLSWLRISLAQKAAQVSQSWKGQRFHWRRQMLRYKRLIGPFCIAYLTSTLVFLLQRTDRMHRVGGPVSDQVGSTSQCEQST
jgi:hypothetical protein